MFSALYLSLPGGQGVCILYARVVFALSTTKKKVIFVVIRTFLLLEIDVFITRGVCFSSDDEDAEKKRNTCADKCANEPSLVISEKKTKPGVQFSPKRTKPVQLSSFLFLPPAREVVARLIS